MLCLRLRSASYRVLCLEKNIAEKYGDEAEVWHAQLAYDNGFKQRQERGLTGDWFIYSNNKT